MEGTSPQKGKVRLGVSTAVVVALSLFGLFYVQARVLPQSIIRYAERSLELKVSGNIKPVWGQFAFWIDPLETLWDQKIKINSGRLHVRYEIKDFFTGKFHIVISGEEVDAELLGDWVSIAGGHSAVFKVLYADLVLSHKGIKEIRALRAESPALQFRFGEAANRQLKETHEA